MPITDFETAGFRMKKKKKTCMRTFVEQSYGGGHRYHCPECDVRKTEFGTFMITWTNGKAPQMCENKK